MALQLYMIGLTVQDLNKSQEFYRRLGLALPTERAQKLPVMIKMNEEFPSFCLPDRSSQNRQKPVQG